MGVYIKGMEMPTSCMACLFQTPYMGGWCSLLNDNSNAYSRRRDCPLIPVPSHGDLIDRDALMKHKGDCYDAKGHLLYAVGTGNIMRAPTIIPAEEGE